MKSYLTNILLPKDTLVLSSLFDMEGTIPSEILSLSNLRLLDLSGSSWLSGTITADFTKLSFLECLDLSNVGVSASLSSESCNTTLDTLPDLCSGMNLKDCSCCEGTAACSGDEIGLFGCSKRLWTEYYYDGRSDHITENAELSNEHLEL